MLALFGLWRFAIYAAIIAAIIGGLAYQKSAYDERRREEGALPYKIAIANQKQEAREILARETAKSAKITQRWIDYARTSDDDYAKRLDAIRNTPVGGGLYDPAARRWACSNPASADKGSTGTPKDDAEQSRLSGDAEQFLYAEAKRADEVAAWALSCHAFVNGKID